MSILLLYSLIQTLVQSYSNYPRPLYIGLEIGPGTSLDGDMTIIKAGQKIWENFEKNFKGLFFS